MQKITADPVRLLKDLIRIDTSNPPGNELPACRYLAAWAEAEGFQAAVTETAPGRGNVVVRWPGSDPAADRLILLSHLDVVPAVADHWQHPPFAASEADGVIYGRGCLDTKQLTAISMAALSALKAAGYRPARDLLLIATADEERGSTFGLRALLEAEPALFDDAAVITEGGGFALKRADGDVYLLEVGQKGRAVLRLSKPKTPMNPFTPDYAAFLDSLELICRMGGIAIRSGEHARSRALLAALQTVLVDSPRHGDLYRTFTENTFSVTSWKSFDAAADGLETELTVDLRMLPGITEADLRDALERRLTPLGFTWAIDKFEAGNLNEADSRLAALAERALLRHVPDGRLLPFISPGGSDAKVLRSRGLAVFGFSPIPASDVTYDEALLLVHGTDERIAGESLGFGTNVLLDLIESYDGGSYE